MIRLPFEVVEAANQHIAEAVDTSAKDIAVERIEEEESEIEAVERIEEEEVPILGLDKHSEQTEKTANHHSSALDRQEVLSQMWGHSCQTRCKAWNVDCLEMKEERCRQEDIPDEMEEVVAVGMVVMKEDHCMNVVAAVAVLVLSSLRTEEVLLNKEEVLLCRQEDFPEVEDSLWREEWCWMVDHCFQVVEHLAEDRRTQEELQSKEEELFDYNWVEQSLDLIENLLKIL